MSTLHGKVVLITGAGDGIGAATATTLAKAGARVVVTDIRVQSAMAVAAEIGSTAIAQQLDVRDRTAWRDIVGHSISVFGQLDVLVNNAGFGTGSNIEEQSLDDFERIMEVNVAGVFLGCKEAVSAMKGRGGAIVNVSSVHGIRAAPFDAAYSASKGAVRLLTKSVALYCATKGYKIRCNAVLPGYIQTAQVRKWIRTFPDPEAAMESLVARHPLGFIGEPSDVASAILFLASDASRFSTGSELVVDGGFLL